MKRIFFAAFIKLSFFSQALLAQDNTIIEISGRVTDQEKQQPIPDVSVLVKGTIAGTVTNSSGNFVWAKMIGGLWNDEGTNSKREGK